MNEKVVVDTNVPRVANAVAGDEWDLRCVAACIRAVREVQTHGLLVLDDLGLIVREYLQQLSISGRPGIGDAFARWAHDSQFDPDCCARVSITPDDESFAEFPSDEGLSEFDLADRKFVAVACAHDQAPHILQAVDSKWWRLRDELRAAGVNIQFVCPDTIAELDARKRR